MEKIILASKSPRRIEMLGKYVNDIIVCSSNIKEIVGKDDLPKITVMKIALAKALAVEETCCDKGIIISADTVVYLDKIMGKPKDYNEGFEMLKSLSGKAHSVFTGICIIDRDSKKKVVDYEETIVEFNELTDDLIKRYLNTGEFADKAGAYAIQGYGELFVKAIHGSYNNVKGLPLNKLNNLLTKHFSLNLL